MVGRIYSPQMIIHYKYTKNAENNQGFWTLFLYFLIKQFNMEKRYYSRCMYGGYEQSDFKPSERFEGQSGTRYRFWFKVFCMGLILAIFGIFLCSCKTTQTVIKEETVTRYVDSTIWHTDTTYFEVPKEVYADYTSLLDTLVLETNYALSWSAIDTNNMLLVGELRNKDIKVPIKYLWKEKVITKDTTIFKEHIEYVPKDVIVEKKVTPQWAWWTLFICIGLLGYVGVRLYLKFKPI